MAFGILEDNSSLEHVPGTVLLAEQEAHSEAVTGLLKHGTGAAAHLVLAPQPSEDPNDPLNWPFMKKFAVIMILTLGSTLCASTVSPLLNASLFVLAGELGRPLSKIAIISGYQLLVAGCSGPFVSGLSRKYGKRPAFLFSSLFGLIGSIVGSVSHDYNTLLAARVIQGLSISAYESLVFSVVGDIFFVHQRGLYVAIIGFILSAGSNVSSVVTGSITNSLGWHYLFHFLDMAIGLQLLLVLFFVPETTYHRDARYEVDQTATDNLKELAEVEARHQEFIDGGKVEKTVTTSTWTPPPPKKTFWQEMAIFTGTHSQENLLKLVAAPILCCTNLSACWVVVVSGAVTSFYVAAALVTAQIFSPPPYLLTAAGVGNLSVGPFLGGLLASIILSLINDPLVIWLTKRNKGVFEPEFRLVPIIFGFIGGPALMGYGVVLLHKGNMYLADFLWGMALFGIVFVTTPSSSYAVDAFRDMSSEIFIAGMMFKNFLFYAYSYFVNDWTADAGAAVPFYTFGGLLIGLVSSTVVVYVFGKRYRRFWHVHNVLRMLRIQTHAEL